MAQCCTFITSLFHGYIFITLLVYTFVFKVICLTVSLEITLTMKSLDSLEHSLTGENDKYERKLPLLISATADKQNILFFN